MEPLIIVLGAGALAATGAAGWFGARAGRIERERLALETELGRLAAERSESERQREELEGQRETVAAERDRLQVELERLRTEQEQLRGEQEQQRAAALEEADARAQAQISARMRELEARERALARDEERIGDRRGELERRASRSEEHERDLQRREARLASQEEELVARRDSITRMEGEAIEALEKVAELTPDEARAQIVARVEEEATRSAARKARAIEESAKERAEQAAKSIISTAIQRYAGEYTCERTVSVIDLPSEEMKGRIIGREGRNIRALEAATGVDFIIDDTPECVVISAFNPIRREVARRSLELLLEDGRIHPSRVAAVVKKTEAGFHRIIRDAGAEAADEVGVGGIHPEILKLVGALKYRTSYGQNQWQHALEVAFLCGMMAAELGLDVKKARRSGLLHDIGKVMDQTAEGSHALIGAEFARQHGESPLVVNAIASHHEEVPQETVYACLAQAADAISGARPGARRQVLQSYGQRLSDLERISNAFPGVERSFAVQAGREVRVLVENGRVSDEDVVLLSQEIARKIESEMAYPGQIKVTVIRETRVVNYAR